MLTSEQIRAARMLLRWEQKDLAERSGMSLPTIKRIETKPGQIQVHGSTAEAIQRAIVDAGVILLDDGDNTAGGPGVRLRSGETT